MMLENFTFPSNEVVYPGMSYLSARQDDLSQWPQLTSTEGFHFIDKVPPVEYYSPLTMTGIFLAATVGAVAMIYQFSKRDQTFNRRFDRQSRRVESRSQ